MRAWQKYCWYCAAGSQLSTDIPGKRIFQSILKLVGTRFLLPVAMRYLKILARNGGCFNTQNADELAPLGA
jgi:hypothetical protein